MISPYVEMATPGTTSSGFAIASCWVLLGPGFQKRDFFFNLAGRLELETVSREFRIGVNKYQHVQQATVLVLAEVRPPRLQWQ